MFSVDSDKLDMIYIGVDNPLTLTVENEDCKDLVIKASLGTIKGDSCRFIFRFDDASQRGAITYISISKKKGNKLIEIGKREFRLKSIPSPYASVGNYVSGKIKGSILKAQSIIKLGYEGFDFGANINVESFVLSIIRGDTCYFTNIQNIGNRFEPEVLDAIASVKKGDTVIFKRITIENYNKSNNEVPPIVFYITE